MSKLPAGILALWLAIAPAFAAEVYVVDGTRSEAKFEIRYLLSTVTGRLRDVSGVIVVDPLNPTASSVKFTLETGSVDAGSPELNYALRSAALLDVAKFPQITFQSTVIKDTPRTSVYQVVGDLTLHGLTKRVMLAVEFRGAVRETDGRSRAGFTARTTLNRKDYGINWSSALDQGGVLVGDDIEVTVNLSATSK